MTPSIDVLPGGVPTGSATHPPAITPAETQPKRFRVQLSCTNCRHAKLKCDRQEPCSQCTKKGRASLCTFPVPARPRRAPAVSMQNRLRHLESLVKGVMTGQTPGDLEVANFDANNMRPGNIEFGVPTPNDRVLSHYVGNPGTTNLSTSEPSHTRKSVDRSSEVSGSVVQGVKETTYIGATHWAAILDDIEEVKNYFVEEVTDNALVEYYMKPDTSLLFNSHPPTTREELLGALPEQAIVSQLVARYFASNSPGLHIIHKPSFQKNYRKFWADPGSTPVSWIAMLYALMSLAAFAAMCSGEESPDPRGTHMEMIQIYRRCCAQSLILSNYTQPGRYTIEAMLVYLEGEFIMSTSDQVNCYVLIGATIRLALRLGLHRDSTNVGGNISVCEGEIRRRLWHTLVQIDLLASFHIGLPSMVQGIDSDTAYPRNLRDEDFDEASTELPEGRPETEITPILYTLCKGRIIDVFGRIAAQANRISPPSYEEVIHLDGLLNRAWAKVPPVFHVIPVEAAITDSVDVIIIRFSLALLYHKSRCVLHRKFLLKERANQEYAYSKTVGIDASMELLRFHITIDDAIQPGSRLSQDKWFISSLSMHDFLLAATIVYLDIMGNIASKGKSPSDNAFQHCEAMIKMLEISHNIWLKTRGASLDARKASDVLGLMLGKIRLALGDDSRQTQADHEQNGNGMIDLSLNDCYPPTTLPDNFRDHTGSWPKETVSDSATPSSGLGMQTTSVLPDPLGNMLDAPMNFDWDLFDNHLRPQTVTDQSWPEFSLEDFDFANNDYYNL